MAPDDLVGWVAASFVLATFCAKRMATLRSLAIASNLAFVAYAYGADLWPILVLHSVMLPINAMRLREALYGNGAGGISTAQADSATLVNLTPSILAPTVRLPRRMQWARRSPIRRHHEHR